MKFTCPTFNVFKKDNIVKMVSVLLIFVQLFAYFTLLKPTQTRAATLSGGSVALGDSRPSTSTTYTIDFDNVSLSAIKCIQVRFSESASSFSAVTGLSFSSSAFSGDFVPTPASWSVNTATGGTAKITYTTGETPASATDRTITLTNVTNGSNAENDYYILVDTFNNTDCASSPVDSGVAAFIYSNGQSVSLTVDPSLAFTVAGVSSGGTVNGATTNVTSTATTIPFARVVTASTNAIAEQLMTVSTNASSGYTVYARYTAAPTSGSNSIDDVTGTNASPSAFSAAGTEAFGYTSSDSTLGTGTADRFTSSGGNKWAKFTTTNAEIMYNAGPASSDTADIGYQVGIAGATPAGTYTTTVILTATALY
jgi:hypothetical protein